MAKKKRDRRSVRKLTKVGGKSISVTIPIHLVRELRWREKQKVVVRKVGKRLVVEDWKR